MFVTFQAYLLKDVHAVLQAINANSIFAVDPSDIKDINQATVNLRSLAFLHFAYDMFCNAIDLMCLDLSKKTEPYATNLFEYFNRQGRAEITSFHRHTTIIRLQLILKLLKMDAAFAKNLEESVYRKHQTTSQYENLLFQEISTILQNLRNTGQAPRFNIRFPVQVVNPLKMCDLCDFTYEGNEDNLLAHLSKAHYHIRLAKMAKGSLGRCPLMVNCEWPSSQPLQTQHLGVTHRLARTFLDGTKTAMRSFVGMDLRYSY